MQPDPAPLGPVQAECHPHPVPELWAQPRLPGEALLEPGDAPMGSGHCSRTSWAQL